jgi:selenocysteine-specific elongation factor|tara:strand:- start:10893 stop:12434 length:1542 start_codon:yes stop_codon:yes gene_type:complete
MKHLSIGVLGHVDHGKTSLVKALTGIDTDLLKEEHERGLSIVPGFAYIHSNDSFIDLIDLPGHESFIKNMVSGASGITSILLVIAANEGVMPQTVEHLDIASVLGIDKGIVVLTKTDLLSRNEIIKEREKIKVFLKDTCLKNFNLHEVSSISGSGVDSLKDLLIKKAANFKKKEIIKNNFFLPIDRVFHKQGFGTIVTGTLRHGNLYNKSKIILLPQGEKLSIRGIHVNNKEVTQAEKGQRVAINLRGLKISKLNRGNVISSQNFLKKTKAFEAKIKILERPLCKLKNNSIIHILVGTLDIPARIKISKKNILIQGEEALVKFFFNTSVVTHEHEKFVIRSFSPSKTIGGGKITRIIDTQDFKKKAVTSRKKINHSKRDILDISLDKDQLSMIDSIEKKYLSLEYNIESEENILDGSEMAKKMNHLLLKKGKLVNLNLYDRKIKYLVHKVNLDKVKKIIEQEFPYPDKFTISQVRDLLASSRKSVIPMMEHFDATGITERFGDYRRVRNNFKK